MATITTEGRRVYIQTKYGESCVGALKQLGAHWDAERKAWWLSAAKREAVERIVATSAPVSPEVAETERLKRDCANIIGTARFEGRSYYLVGEGTNSHGQWFRLMFRDDSKAFFKAAGEVEITKRYAKPMTLAKLQEFAEKLKVENDPNAPILEECWECGAQYKTTGNVDSDRMGCRRCG